MRSFIILRVEKSRIFSSLLFSWKLLSNDFVHGRRFNSNKSQLCHEVEFLTGRTYSTMNFDKRSSVIKI